MSFLFGRRGERRGIKPIFFLPKGAPKKIIIMQSGRKNALKIRLSFYDLKKILLQREEGSGGRGCTEACSGAYLLYISYSNNVVYKTEYENFESSHCKK